MQCSLDCAAPCGNPHFFHKRALLKDYGEVTACDLEFSLDVVDQRLTVHNVPLG